MNAKNKEIRLILHDGLLEAIKELSIGYKGSSLTDIFIQVNTDTGDVIVNDDENNIVSKIKVDLWDEEEELCDDTIIDNLHSVLEQLEEEGQFALLDLYKPFSVNYVDENMYIIEELLSIHEEGIGEFDNSLLEKFDKDFDAFLDKILNED